MTNLFSEKFKCFIKVNENNTNKTFLIAPGKKNQNFIWSFIWNFITKPIFDYDLFLFWWGWNYLTKVKTFSVCFIIRFYEIIPITKKNIPILYSQYQKTVYIILPTYVSRCNTFVMALDLTSPFHWDGNRNHSNPLK